MISITDKKNWKTTNPFRAHILPIDPFISPLSTAAGLNPVSTLTWASRRVLLGMINVTTRCLLENRIWGTLLYIVPSLDLVVWKLGGCDSQYSSKDTGLPEPKPLPDAIQPINDGKENGDDDYALTLVKVIGSIQD
jgi:hypothetical protein